ncbi:hypothetical protein KJS94_04450 [Flavihumibacter rivuli]|uniref:hypothetical protein n=1 Tax=Flavihumibacter rivuli TaxID=2838156 RepID=UPI001BDE5ABA|nr:hypothetical protein [Flavihumibacter rivuli]ULQ57449.1 hypothetical protein KJS94_04450 [Flavihumibacter rivuli]
MMKFLLTGIITLFCSFSLMAQDKIYKKGGEVLEVKVEEVGVDDIRYKLFNEPSGPVYAIEKSRIIKIVFENGRVETYSQNLRDKEWYIGQSRHALKVNFLSPLFGYTMFSYERSIKPGKSLEASIGIIGLGMNRYAESYYDNTGNYFESKRSPGGVALGVGYKFIKTPDFLSRNIRFAHLLQGSYVKPQLYTGVYSENYIKQSGNKQVEERRTVAYGSLMVELGKQWVFSDQFLFDLYFGLGYTFDNINDNDTYTSWSNEDAAHHFTNLRLGQSPGFALNGGLRFGFLLK